MAKLKPDSIDTGAVGVDRRLFRHLFDNGLLEEVDQLPENLKDRHGHQPLREQRLQLDFARVGADVGVPNRRLEGQAGGHPWEILGELNHNAVDSEFVGSAHGTSQFDQPATLVVINFGYTEFGLFNPPERQRRPVLVYWTEHSYALIILLPTRFREAPDQYFDLHQL